MRVLMITTDLALGGAERTVINCAHCLQQWGHQCAVTALIEPPDGGRTRHELEEMGVPVLCANAERPWQAYRATGIWRFARRWAPDVLHCHMFHGHAVGFMLRRTGVGAPQVWSYHTLAEQVTAARRAFYRLARRAATAHIYVSHAVQRSRCGSQQPEPDEHVIYNGVDLAPFLEIEPAAGPVFGAVGRLVPRIKGFDLAIRALAQLAAPEARLRIAGDGPIRQDLEDLAQALRVEDRVEFEGFVRDVPAFLAGVNIFVNPSRWEAFGNTLVEGMAAGLPCIASRVDGLAEVGGEMVTFVPPEDVDALAGAMSAALRRGALSPAELSRQRAYVQRFSRETMARAYLEVYRRIAGT